MGCTGDHNACRACAAAAAAAAAAVPIVRTDKLCFCAPAGTAQHQAMLMCQALGKSLVGLLGDCLAPTNHIIAYLYTFIYVQAGAHAAVADLGGSIITGIDGNPLAVLSAQLGIPMHTIGPDCDLLLPDGSKASKLVDNQVRAWGVQGTTV